MKKIIFVDDKIVYRDAVKNLLKKLGEVDVIAEATSGEEFLEILEHKKPDLVFMDIQLPKMSGIEATRKALQKHKDIVVIGLSIFDDQKYVNQLIEAGGKGYLLKLSNNIAIFQEIIENPNKRIFLSKELEKDIDKKKKKILMVVDDFGNTRDLVAHTLSEANYQVLKASDGQEAIRLFNGQEIDLLITDLHMPRMNGFELIEEVKKIEQYKKIPIVMLTTEVSKDKKLKAKKLGITGWIQKPFQMFKFLKTIGKIFK